MLVFLNGWNMGQFAADIGPQHTFVLPNGVLDPHGANTLALAVTGAGGAGDALGPVRLAMLGLARGGVRLHIDAEDNGHPVLIETERQLAEYFAGHRTAVHRWHARRWCCHCVRAQRSPTTFHSLC